MQTIKKHYLFIIVPLIFIITFIAWYYDLLLYTVAFYTVIVLCNTIFLKDSSLNLYLLFFIPPLLRSIVSGATMEDFDEDSLREYLIFAIPVIILYGNLLYGIFKGRARIKLTPLLKGMIVFFLAMIPSVFVTINPYNTYLMFGIYLNSVLLFFYFLSQDIKKEHFFTMSILFALQASLQMLLVLFQGDIAELVLNKQITIGWSVSNNIGQYIVFALPFLTYFSIKYKSYSYFFHLLFIFLLFALFMTGARASFLSLAIILPILLFIHIKNSTVKENSRDLLVLIPFTSIIVYILNEFSVLESIWTRLLSKTLDSSGRLELWKNSIDHFSQYKIFGSGLLTTSEFEFPLTSYHNILIDSLTNTGIIGFSATIFFIIMIIVSLYKNKSLYNSSIALALITVLINALLDTVHLNPITLMLIFVTFAFIEFTPNKSTKKISSS